MLVFHHCSITQQPLPSRVDTPLIIAAADSRRAALLRLLGAADVVHS